MPYVVANVAGLVLVIGSLAIGTGFTSGRPA